MAFEKFPARLDGMMPRYFFDTQNGDLLLRDDEGFELENDEEARAQALDALPDMARETMPNGDRRMFTSSVRDETGRVIYSATLSLVGHWQIDQEAEAFDRPIKTSPYVKPS